MRKENAKAKATVWLGWLVVGMTAMLGGCGQVDVQWTEEVLMTGGELLIVSGTAKGKKQGKLGGPGWWEPTEMTINVTKLPENWQQPPVWRSEFVQVLLDYQPEEHTWSLVATSYSCDGWRKMGRPKLPYTEYQSKNGGPWVVVPLEERLIGRKTNLLPGPNSGGEPNLITVPEKEKRLRGAAGDFREIVNKWAENC